MTTDHVKPVLASQPKVTVLVLPCDGYACRRRSPKPPLCGYHPSLWSGEPISRLSPLLRTATAEIDKLGQEFVG